MGCQLPSGLHGTVSVGESGGCPPRMNQVNPGDIAVQTYLLKPRIRRFVVDMVRVQKNRGLRWNAHLLRHQKKVVRAGGYAIIDKEIFLSGEQDGNVNDSRKE